jgi:hypothetical protein
MMSDEKVNASETRKNHMNIFPQLTLKGETPPPQADFGLVAVSVSAIKNIGQVFDLSAANMPFFVKLQLNE